MVSVRRGGRDGWRRAPRGTAFTTSPAGHPGGPLGVVAAGNRPAHQRPCGPVVTVSREGRADQSAMCGRQPRRRKRDPALFPVPGRRSVYGLRTDDKKPPDMSRFARSGRCAHSVGREANGSVGRVVKLVGTRGGFQTGRTCGTGARLVFRYPSASSRAPPVAPFVQRHRDPPR